jgi:GNAT superfamily N-acetyltransferase
MTSMRVRPEARRPKVEVVRVSDHHVASLAEFFRAVWDPAATTERVRQARVAAAESNPASPGQAIPTFLFLSDGRALGHLTTIPVRLWSHEGEHPAHFLKGLMVLPEHRNGPIGSSLVKEAVRHLGCALAIAVQPAAWKLCMALGFVHLGVMSNHLRVLRPARVLRLDLETLGLSGLPPWLPRAARLVRRRAVGAVLGAGAAAVMRVWTAAARARTLGLTVSSADPAPDPAELDGLWRLARGSMAAASVRDARYVRWRYGGGDGPGDDAPYGFVTVRERSALVGLAVVRRPNRQGDRRLGGLRVATLSDVLFSTDRTDVGLAALAGAETLARRFESDALLCSASHSRLRALLPLQAYVPVPGNLHVLARDPQGACGLPARLSDWWLTRGDGDGDEVF